MIDFQSLRKQVKNIDKSGFRKVRIAILGNYSTQFLSQAISYSGLKKSIDFEIYNADYDQIESEVYNSNSGLYEFKPDYLFITISSLKLQDKFYSLTDNQKIAYVTNSVSEVNNWIHSINLNLTTKIIINNFELLNDQVFGSISSKVDLSFPPKLYSLNYELIELSKKYENLYLFDLNALIQNMGAQHVRDWSYYINADLHFSLDFHALFSERLVDFITAFLGDIKKCIILDLDNTLWGGIIGDDGMQGIEIGFLGIGKSFTQLQKWIKQLKNRGILVAICSKNTESIAKEPFESHPDMELRLDDIAVFMANWDNKADNLRVIQKVLNIGYDSMVFVDDNPAEREIIRKNHPAVCVPELPEDPSEYLSYLKSLNLFETASFSATDINRTKQYQEESQRQKLQFAVTDIAQYLTELDMKITIEPFQLADISRIAQLSQRSNQFNLRTVRYSENEITEMINSQQYYLYQVKLNDKFGDYGLISVVFIKKLSEKELFIENWLMSCRVLKRGVEDAVLNYIVNKASQNGYKVLKGEYIPSKKNSLVKDHYEQLHFVSKNDYWELDINSFKLLKTYIN